MTKSIHAGLFGSKRLTGCALAAALLFAGMSALAANVAKIGEETFGSLADAFAAVQSGETVVILNGEHDCTADNAFAGLGKKTVTLRGESQDGTVLDMGRGNKTGVQTTPGTNLTLEDMTLKFDHSGSGSPMYDHTFFHPASQTFRNVTIVGQIDIMDDTLFESCTFTGAVNEKDEYLLWCYACTAELVDCTFKGSGTKAPVKLYNEGAQCGLKVSGTTFEALGTYGCAVYSSNKYPENNVYEITVGENVTAPAEAKVVRSSDVGLTVINPTKDEQGKYTGGTFESEKKSAEEIVEIAKKYAGEGFAPVIDPETRKVVVGEKTYARVTSFARTGTDVTLGWEVVDGLQYQVEWSDSLDETAVWTPHGMPSATSPVTLPDQTASSRFYRVFSLNVK